MASSNLGLPIAGWLSATQARLGMPDEARATLTGFYAEDELRGGIRTVRAVASPRRENPSAALGLLQDVLDAPTPVGLPAFALVDAQLLAGIADALPGTPAPSAEGELQSPAEELSPGGLRVLRYLPTNLTRPEIARELYLSNNTVSTHIRHIYSKLGTRDRSSAVRRARELRLLSTTRN